MTNAQMIGAAAQIERLRAKLAEAESMRDYALSEMKSARIYRNIETGHARDAEARAEAAEKRLAEASAVIEPFAYRYNEIMQTTSGRRVAATYVDTVHLRAAAEWMEKNQ